MTHVAYVAAGWVLTLGATGLYAWRVVRRGRVVAQRVPVDQRRWG